MGDDYFASKHNFWFYSYAALMSVCHGWNDFLPDFFASIVVFRKKIRARGILDNAPGLLHDALGLL